ncbi:hypothetical protein [Fontivita pretiosa]|uniref:hypothetical protein n=1 Tax=Fontivita pretiosa TaxID=2989684 RepID=UPI003D1830C9
MERILSGIFALLVAAAGWFYIFYSRAAANLAGIENPRTNRLRIALRRTGGAAMFLLAVAFYAFYVAIERRRVTWAAVLLLSVLALLGAIVVLGLVDLRLTYQLRRRRRHHDDHSDSSE